MTDQELLSFIESCMEMGITTFDHADIYGDYTCETLFGKALQLKPSLRDNMRIVTKCGIAPPSPKFPEHYVAHYNTSTEHIDVLLIHRPDPFMNPAEVAEAFSRLKQEGNEIHPHVLFTSVID